MFDIFADVERWVKEGKAVAVATVVETWGSSPRQVGAKLALTAAGEIRGSVSGGCVEGAVVEAGLEVLESGQPRLLHFGVADERAWEVGLACGGRIEVFVQPLTPASMAFWREQMGSEQAGAALTVIRGPGELVGQQVFLRGDAPPSGQVFFGWAAAALPGSRATLRGRAPQRVRVSSEKEEVEVFVEVALPAPVLVVVGGVHIAVALTSLAKTLGYQTVIVDPRRAFGAEARFPHADRLVRAWPDEALRGLGIHAATAIAVLSHDPKLDDPALMVALRSPAFYVGALGSRTTQAKRRARLREAGFGEAELARLRGPIGLEIGARTPEEIALAIMAEVTMVRNGRGEN